MFLKLLVLFWQTNMFDVACNTCGDVHLQFRMHCCQSYMLEASGGHVKDLAMLLALSFKWPLGEGAL